MHGVMKTLKHPKQQNSILVDDQMNNSFGVERAFKLFCWFEFGSRRLT